MCQEVESVLGKFKEQNEANQKSLLQALKETKNDYDSKKALASEQTEHNV